MSDYIKREDAIDGLRDHLHYMLDGAPISDFTKMIYEMAYRHCIDKIKSVPAADVREVVLCRDCKYYNTTGCADGYGWCEDSVVSTGVWDNFFCGRADMRGEDDG